MQPVKLFLRAKLIEARVSLGMTVPQFLAAYDMPRWLYYGVVCDNYALGKKSIERVKNVLTRCGVGVD